MVIITFPNGTDWYKANWAFRQLAKSAVARFPNNEELASRLEEAASIGLLRLSNGDAVASILKTVASEILSGEIPICERPNDPGYSRQIVEAMRELCDLLEGSRSGS